MSLKIRPFFGTKIRSRKFSHWEASYSYRGSGGEVLFPPFCYERVPVTSRAC